MRTIPGEVRERVLADHAVLRRMIRELRRRAHKGGDGPALRSLFTDLLDALGAHLSLEDDLLVPTLAVVDPSLAELVEGEHDSQRAWIRRMLATIADSSCEPSRLIAELLLFTEDLERDMNVEEAAVIDAEELPDDPFGFELPS